MRADSIKVEAGVGPITGTYNASNVLVLDTANAPIAVRANLFGGSGHVVRLYMKTSNGYVVDPSPIFRLLPTFLSSSNLANTHTSAS